MYTYPADSEQITTNAALLDFARWRPCDNSGETLLDASTRLGIDTGAIQDELNVTGTFTSGLDVVRAFKMKILQATMMVAIPPSARPVMAKPPVATKPRAEKKDYGPPRPRLPRKAKDAPVVYAGGVHDDTDKDTTWLVGEDFSRYDSDVGGDSSPLEKKRCVPKAVCLGVKL